jgi:hypothetical protein
MPHAESGRHRTFVPEGARGATVAGAPHSTRLPAELHLVDEIATTAAGKFQTIMPLAATRKAAVLSAISSRPEPEALPRRKTA